MAAILFSYNKIVGVYRVKKYLNNVPFSALDKRPFKGLFVKCEQIMNFIRSISAG
jgi:hypothetical protein